MAGCYILSFNLTWTNHLILQYRLNLIVIAGVWSNFTWAIKQMKIHRTRKLRLFFIIIEMLS